METREKQDAMPRGLYRKLVDDGSLIVEDGLYVSSPQTLVNYLVEKGIAPSTVLCDTFEFGGLKGATMGRWPEPEKRRTRWSESTEDIAAFHKLTLDGPLSIAPESVRFSKHR